MIFDGQVHPFFKHWERFVNWSIAPLLWAWLNSIPVDMSAHPSQVFQPEIVLLITQFRSSMKSSFSLSRSIIRDTTHANALLSALRTNYELLVDRNGNEIHHYAKYYHLCSCASSPSCIEKYVTPANSNSTMLFTVPGFYTGCFVIEALLQSTLECFYD